MIEKYLNTYKVIYNIIKDFSKNYRKKPLRIELLKLTYLVDVEFYKKYGEKYSELNYIYYNFGPWDRMFHQIINYMSEVEILEFPRQSKDGKPFYLYSLANKIPRNDIKLEKELSEILENIFFIYKYSQLSQMLEAVYTQEPMASTEPGECIDMSVLKLNARDKRNLYRNKRKSSLDKIESLENNMDKDDLELFSEFQTLRDRANGTI